MQYPIETVYDPILGEIKREMSAATYDKHIQWLGEDCCDGLPDFKTRHMLHRLPMNYNVYFN